MEQNEGSALPSAVAAAVKLVSAEHLVWQISEDGLSDEEGRDEHEKILFTSFGRVFVLESIAFDRRFIFILCIGYLICWLFTFFLRLAFLLFPLFDGCTRIRFYCCLQNSFLLVNDGVETESWLKHAFHFFLNSFSLILFESEVWVYSLDGFEVEFAADQHFSETPIFESSRRILISNNVDEQAGPECSVLFSRPREAHPDSVH